MFDAYLLPRLKFARASTVTIDDIEILLEDMAKRAPVQANRVRALVRHVYAWALSSRSRRRRFSLTMNPCQYVPRLADEKPRERVYSEEELKALWDAFDKVGIVGELFKLQLLTAARKGELSKMEWSEVDLRDEIWTQPGTKAKNGKPHIVPLSSEAVRIFERLQQRQTGLKNASKRESNFVFCSSGTGDSAMTWLQKIADRARMESKVADFQAHDLRRTCATRLARAGVPDVVLKMILNHSLGKDITGVYNQYKYFDERKKALSAWSCELLAIVRDQRYRFQVGA
jgi:integrase